MALAEDPRIDLRLRLRSGRLRLVGQRPAAGRLEPAGLPAAKWSGWLVDAHAGAAYALRLGDFYARPELSLDYIRLNEDGYQERGGGTGFDLKVDSRNGDLLTGQALVAFGWQFDGGGTFDKGPQEYDVRATVRFRF